MKFPNFKGLRESLTIPSLQDVVGYLRGDNAEFMRDISAGLNRLSFTDNFECFEVDLTFAASEEKKIGNILKRGPPTKWMVVRNTLNGSAIIDGSTTWNATNVYLKNSSLTAAQVRVLFFK